MTEQPMNDPRLARLEHICAEQDERSRRHDARRQREVAALKAATDADTPTTTIDRDRLTLLDRIADRCPEFGNVGDHEVEWMELAEDDEALVLDRSGFAEGTGAYFMLDGDNVLAIGPLGRAHSGVIVIRPDGSRVLARLVPLAEG